MLDITFIRENAKFVQQASAAKGVIINVDDLLKIDEKLQKLRREAQVLREERNTIAKSIKGKPTIEHSHAVKQ